MTSENLVVLAATAMFEESHGEGSWNHREFIEEDLYLRRARAALSVFEEAHAATDDERWRNNLSYAATALEASADNGDRYCARLIREHLASAGSGEYYEGLEEGIAIGRRTPATAEYEFGVQAHGDPAPAFVISDEAAARASVARHPDKWYLARRTKAVPAGEWEPAEGNASA